MKHFRGMSREALQECFYVCPSEFSRDAGKRTLGIAMGASLYMPGTMKEIAVKLTGTRLSSLTSVILCLEDAVSDGELAEAEENVIRELKVIESLYITGKFSDGNLPLLFIRVRNTNQLQDIAERLGSALELVTGIVFPKCTSSNAQGFFRCLQELNMQRAINLYGLPILETKEILYSESREQELARLYVIFKQFEELILTIRVGATDFASLLSLRRSRLRPIYDLRLVADCLLAIVNKFGRRDDSFLISGPVYEHFEDAASTGTFDNPSSADAVLWEEVQLDSLNGFMGKTCIHPSHIAIINAAYAIPKEAYDDARAITEQSIEMNGVLKSPAKNKMNEVKPHYNWALNVLAQAEIYGVLKENVTSFDFLRRLRTALV
ncbi:HpcH/HpaI aldolase/citrate lyase family protein [Planococcus lenghuensis]|uniref:Citrate lyase beta subunit n=1 Tax=Planococcus lenghuensis TaxID=2213202 RepID=A0A1Q2KW30_9BACL|nr:HpcH/HpaI aldolase/citrate lyase family protein [Planococcus lenghuensis]AQQ52425.1 hypothetical protein B0X71_04400 [Planococcus lenghuensis]